MDFFYKHKTIIFLILFLLFSTFLAFILYFLFFYSSKTPSPVSTSTSINNNLPEAKDGQGQNIISEKKENLPIEENLQNMPAPIKANTAKGGLTKTTILNKLPGSEFTSSKDGNKIQFYNQNDGKFYNLDSQGNLTPLSDKVFYNVKNVSWSNSKDKAIIEYPDGANIIYDFNKEKQITLPKHWEDFEFSPNDQQIVAKNIGLDSSNRWLTISNYDGSNNKNIEPLGTNADIVYPSWSPNNQSIAMFTKGIDFDRQQLYFIGQNKENFKSTIIEGRGFQSLWSPDGTKLLYSVYSSNSDLKPNLWTVNAQGENIGSERKNLELETWVSKCTFANSTDVYCAVPQNLKKGAGLFPDLANSTSDIIYKINITNGFKKIISIPDGSFTISNIIISKNEKTIFFTDKNTHFIYKIDM